MSRKNFLPLFAISLATIFSGVRLTRVHAGTASSCYPALSFVTSSIPSATAGSSYTTTLAATGGQPPYSWSFGQSSLPSGFSIGPNGDLTGTPTAAGNYVFHVVVSDSLKNNVTGALILTVVNAGTPPPPVSPTPTPPTPAPPTPTPPMGPIGPATGKALTECRDIRKGGTYYLANDVSSAGTCFGIDANNIKLNLNGHTITYGTGGGFTPTPAIENHACSYHTGHYAGGYCGYQGGGLEVYGGTIVQSPNSAAFSDVFSFGQGNYSSAPYIHDITAKFQNQGAQFYYSTYLPPGARIENNTIYDNVTNIQEPGQGMLSARAQFQGQAIFIMGNNNAPGSGDIISGNKIIGSPQGGIRSTNQNTVISNNDVSMNSLYTNDYCFEVEADHTVVTGNNCHPTSGRGLNFSANYVTISNNIFNVTELKQNMEYGSNGQPGCEIDGAYGVRMKTGIPATPMVGTVISNNQITVTAGACNASGVDFSLVPEGTQVTVSGNTITTVNLGQGAQDFGFSFDSAYVAGVVETGNTVTSTTAYVYDNWDGSNGITIGHNTWQGSPQYTVEAGDSGCPPGGNNLARCPVIIQLTDSLPNNVLCGNYSTATVSIGGQVTQCTPPKH